MLVQERQIVSLTRMAEGQTPLPSCKQEMWLPVLWVQLSHHYHGTNELVSCQHRQKVQLGQVLSEQGSFTVSAPPLLPEASDSSLLIHRQPLPAPLPAAGLTNTKSMTESWWAEKGGRNYNPGAKTGELAVGAAKGRIQNVLSVID